LSIERKKLSSKFWPLRTGTGGRDTGKEGSKALPGKLRTFRFALVCTGLLAGLLLGCDGGTSIKGVVLDSADKPVVDAKIKLTVGHRVREEHSSEYGVFKIGTLHSPWNPELSLSITKEGCRPFEKRFHADEHLQSIVVTLQGAI